MRRLLAAAWVAIAACGQSLEILSEFQRVDLEGRIVAPDRGEKPREILSPAVARNAYASYHVVVKAPRGQGFTLHIGQNPESVIEARLFREAHWVGGTDTIPDALRPVPLPFTLASGEAGGREQNVYCFWLDLWVPASAPVRRIRVEAQLNVGQRWIIYPMEVRIIATTAPTIGELRGPPLPAVTEGADAAALAPLAFYLCGTPLAGRDPGPLSVRRLIRRNATQDALLAKELEARHGRAAVAGRILGILGVETAEAWCRHRQRPRAGAEWYLKVRDLLYRGPF